MPARALSLFVLCLVACCASPVCADDDRWWPRQVRPTAIVRTSDFHALPAPGDAYQLLLQSVAGLAAKGVNERRLDELVWVSTNNPDLEAWYAAAVKGPEPLALRGTFSPWELVDRYRERGIIKGYILYRSDSSAGELNAHRPQMDLSVNVATSLAGLLDGVLVEQRLEPQAKAHGLKRLEDARDKSQAWCFATYRERFNRRLLCAQDPKKPHVRDLAIAHQALTLYGDDEPLAAALEWLEPLSPILGWNGGDEFNTTRLSSVYGQIQTATDWCMNLPVLMAGSDREQSVDAPPFDPNSIDWYDRRSGVCFIDTDGDNVQWLEGSFFRNPYYWASPDRGKVPFGWSCCFSQLVQLCPQALHYALETRTPRDSFIEWGGGYYYPDLFAQKRPDRWALMARQAQLTWSLMRRTGTQIIAFNVARLDAPETREACQAFAAETDGLLAILLFQYAPYEAGAGKTFWVKDRNGEEVPVISARYSIWEHGNARPRSGTPAKVAREIRQTVDETPATDLPRYDWAIAHVWSYFRHAPGTDESAEDLPQNTAPAQGGLRGYMPVTWCIERLPPEIRVIGPEELAWRLRMQRNPAATRKRLAR